MKKLQLLFVFLLLSVIGFGQLTVTVPTITATPGQTVNIPVKLYGASSSGVPVSSANLSIPYDTNKLTFVGIVNFYSGTPTSEWFYSGNYDADVCNSYTISANWLQSAMNTVAIPDGTTLYEIQFVYKGGNSALNFCIHEFTGSGPNYDLIQNTTASGAVNMVPASLTGPTAACLGVAGNVYTTDTGKTNYSWSVTGGIVTSGGSSSQNTATVTWNTAGSQSITASYTGANSTSLPVTVTPGPLALVSIAASANPVCLNASVTFTATPTNGGTIPVYQWKKNGTNVGSNSATYTYVPANNDVITCALTSSEVCITGIPAISNSIVMTVNPLTSGVSISVSANNVVAGAPVTFTAVPVNGGTAPVYVWRVNNSISGTNSPTFTYTPANGDVVFCLITPNAPCVNASFTSNVITMTVITPAGSLLVTLPNKTAMPGDILYYPVKLKGASSSGKPISSANIQITYDPAVLHYDTLVNFYAAMPTGQWFFSGNLNIVAANWMEPSLMTLPVPDSTTLFEIKFTYLGGTSALPFAVNEFTNATYDFIPTNHVNGDVNQLVPSNTTVQNATVSATHDTCFNALQVITVAGNGTVFTIQNGGSATFVAGQKISFLPGTTVAQNGYLHGYITQDGHYCNQPLNPVVNTKTSDEETTSIPEMISNQAIHVYPNPTTGIFMVEVKGESQVMLTKAEIYSISGTKLHTVVLANERKHEFSVTELKPGLYFIHIFTNDRSEILKFVKL